jgi:hypothetical protein
MKSTDNSFDKHRVRQVKVCSEGDKGKAAPYNVLFRVLEMYFSDVSNSYAEKKGYQEFHENAAFFRL